MNQDCNPVAVNRRNLRMQFVVHGLVFVAALALWAAQRIGLPIDIAVRGDDHAPLVQPFADRGVDARLTDGASADRAALRWRVAE